MFTSVRAAQDPVVARIRALLLAARPQLQADSRALDRALPEEPAPPEASYVDPVTAITTMRRHIQSLRASVLAVPGGGPSAASARELTARALLESEQSLDKLAQSLDAMSPDSAGSLWAESVQLAKQARTTSVTAEQALGIPWPI